MSSQGIEQFATEGYCVLTNKVLRDHILSLRDRFKNNYATRFGDDAHHNRNLIKRFGDSLDVARLMAAPELEDAIRSIGLIEPVFCGPVVTHYTSHDVTGKSYGLPYHQDWPSMASSRNSLIVWLNLTASGPDSHGIEMAPGFHTQGLLDGVQEVDGYVLKDQSFENGIVPVVDVGNIVVMSAFLPHRTFVNPDYMGWKLSLSRRFDDLACIDWQRRHFVNAYGTTVDRDLYLR